MSDYRVNVKVSNGRIRRAMEAAGYDTVAKLCEDHDIDSSPVYDLINLRKSPFNSSHEWRPVVLKLADALNVMPDDLFSENQKTFTLKTNTGTKDVTEHEMLRLINDVGLSDRLTDQQENAGFRMIADEQADKIIQDSFSNLSEHQQFVVKAMSGMHDGRSWSAEEIAEKLNITPAKVSKIHCAALDKMKTLKNIDGLVEVAEDFGINTRRSRIVKFLLGD